MRVRLAKQINDDFHEVPGVNVRVAKLICNSIQELVATLTVETHCKCLNYDFKIFAKIRKIPEKSKTYLENIHESIVRDGLRRGRSVLIGYLLNGLGANVQHDCVD